MLLLLRISRRLRIDVGQIARPRIVRQQYGGIVEAGVLWSSDGCPIDCEHLCKARVVQLACYGSRYVVRLDWTNRLERHLCAILPDRLEDGTELSAVDVQLFLAIIEGLLLQGFSDGFELPLKLGRRKGLLELDLPRLQHVIDAVIRPHIARDTIILLYLLHSLVTLNILLLGV